MRCPLNTANRTEVNCVVLDCNALGQPNEASPLSDKGKSLFTEFDAMILCIRANEWIGNNYQVFRHVK